MCRLCGTLVLVMKYITTFEGHFLVVFSKDLINEWKMEHIKSQMVILVEWHRNLFVKTGYFSQEILTISTVKTNLLD